MTAYTRTLFIIGKRPEIIMPKYAFRAYKDGICVEFGKQADALKFSHLVEKFCFNQSQVNENNEAITKYDILFDKTFKELLKIKFPVIYFDELYNMANCYADGNYIELEEQMEKLKIFFERCSGILSQESQNYQLGLLYPEGFYAGSMNGYDYFVASNNNEKMNWDESVSYYNSSDFVLPTKDELIMMYNNKTAFNANCTNTEKWNNNYYWSSSEEGINDSLFVNFNNGNYLDNGKSHRYYVRGVRKIPMN
jgi:hypothetical protein